MKKKATLYTGYHGLDSILMGFRKGDLVLIASRPGVGKSDLAMNISLNVGVRQDTPIAYFVMEQKEEYLVERMLCADGNMEHQKIRNGSYGDEEDDFMKMTMVAATLEKAPIFIFDDPNPTVSEIREKCLEVKEQHDLGMVIIDYVQLVKPDSIYDNRYQEVAEISRSLKILARELDVTVVAVSQLSRNLELRENKRPIMPDLRDSGTLEDDADVVMFLYREEYYGNAEIERRNIAEVNVAKHRNGPTGIAELAYLKSCHKFVNLERF